MSSCAPKVDEGPDVSGSEEECVAGLDVAVGQTGCMHHGYSLNNVHHNLDTVAEIGTLTTGDVLIQ